MGLIVLSDVEVITSMRPYIENEKIGPNLKLSILCDVQVGNHQFAHMWSIGFGM